MSEGERPIIEEVLDYAVYAPLGLALTVAEDLPELVRRGKARIGTQVGIARFVGKIAIGRARRRLDDMLAPSPDVSAPPAASSDARPVIVPSAAARGLDKDRLSPTVDALGIPGYDTLPASQVVARLSGLSPEELAAVRRYEELHRARRTILARVDQLQASRHEH